MYLLTQTKTGMSALELHRHLGVSYRTAWLVKHKLMAVMFEQERDRRLEGVVQIDDAFLGGERTGGKRGRGSENKVPLVAAVQTTASGQAIFTRLDVLPNWKVPTVARWAVKALGLQRTSSATASTASTGSRTPTAATSPSSTAPASRACSIRVSWPSTRCWAPEDVDEHHLPRLQDWQLRHALHGRIPVPLQSPI